MKYTSTGIPARFPFKRNDGANSRAGFTLVEVLVALSLLLAFAAALGPVLSHGRQILMRGNGEVHAQLLLRTLLDPTLNPSLAETGAREDQTDGFRWRVAAEPFAGAASLDQERNGGASATPFGWSLYKMTAEVDWGGNRSLSAECLRLIKVD